MPTDAAARLRERLDDATRLQGKNALVRVGKITIATQADLRAVLDERDRLREAWNDPCLQRLIKHYPKIKGTAHLTPQLARIGFRAVELAGVLPPLAPPEGDTR